MKVAIFSKSLLIRHGIYSLTRAAHNDVALVQGTFDEQAAATLAQMAGALGPRVKTFDSAVDPEGNVHIFKRGVPVCICVPETSAKFSNRIIISYKAAK